MTHLPHAHDENAEKLFGHMPAPEEFSASADLFKLMSDGTRIKLFWLLCHCEECLQDLSAMMDMSSPALSHHLQLLKKPESRVFLQFRLLPEYHLQAELKK